MIRRGYELGKKRNKPFGIAGNRVDLGLSVSLDDFRII